MPDISWDHAAEARAALNAIVTDPQHGVAALSSPQTMSNLLKDLLPDAPREKSILVAAAEAGLADTLREHVAQGMDTNTAISLTASSFSSSTPFTPDACTWVAGELAIALGISQGAGGQQVKPGLADQGMPTQINPIPGFRPAAQPQANATPAQAQGLPTQVAPQSFPPGPGQPGYTPPIPASGYGPAAPATGQPGYGSPAPVTGQPGYNPAAPAGGFPAASPPVGYGPGAGQPGYNPSAPGGGYAAGVGGQATVGGYSPGVPTTGYSPGGQVGGYGPPPGSPVGYGPGGPYGPTPGKSGTKRGLLIGGGILALIIVIIVIAASLSSKGTSSASGSTTPSPPPTTSTVTPTPPPSPSVESLATIMHPAGFSPVGTGCTNQPLKGLNEATVTGQLFCPHTSINGTRTNQIVVWAYQFDSHSDYLAGFAKINSATGFKSASATANCPPKTSTGFGSEVWDSTSNPKYGKSHEPEQKLECFIQYTTTHKYQPLLIWTMGTQDVVFIARNEAPGGTFTQLDKWWDNVSYG